MVFLFSVWNIKLVPLIWVCWQYGVLLLYNLSNWLFFLLIAITGLINSMINPPHIWSSRNCKVFPSLGSASTQRTSVEMMEVQALRNQAMGLAVSSVCFSCLLGVVLCLCVLPLLLQTVTLAGLMSQRDLTLCTEFHTRWLWLGGASWVWVQGFVGSYSIFPKTRL